MIARFFVYFVNLPCGNLSHSSVSRDIEKQLKAVCYRERLEPEIGFSFYIGHKSTWVEIFFRIKEMPRFLSLAPSLSIHFSLETREEMENDAEWQAVAEHRVQVAARYLAADLARDGIPAEMKRYIVLIAQFSKSLSR